MKIHSRFTILFCTVKSLVDALQWVLGNSIDMFQEGFFPHFEISLPILSPAWKLKTHSSILETHQVVLVRHCAAR